MISIVIPVYQNQDSLEKTLYQILTVFEGQLPRYDFEVIFINDGSTDGSLKKLRELQATHPTRVKLISFSRNFGQNAAMIAGNRHARGRCVINISADLQDPVDLMPQMVAKWEAGHKIVGCMREQRRDSFTTRMFSGVLYKILRMSVPAYPKHGFDYYLIDRKVLEVINLYHDRNNFLLYDILETGFKPFYIPYTRIAREFGKSGYTFAKKFKAAFDIVINTSYLPIRMASFLGLLTAFTAFVYAVSIAHARLTNQIHVEGHALIIILILFFAGLNLLMLGLVGEYLWRVYDLGKGRPMYVIDESYLH